MDPGYFEEGGREYVASLANQHFDCHWQHHSLELMPVVRSIVSG